LAPRISCGILAIVTHSKHPDAPQSGPWTEQYTAQTVEGTESDAAVMDCELKFHGEHQSALDGAGANGDVRFAIEGRYERESGALRFRKRYADGETYAYVGHWKKGAFTGRWRLVNGAQYGRFTLKPGAMASFDASSRGVQSLFRRRAKSWQKLCALDLDAVRFDGEKEMLSLLLADEDYLRELQSFHAEKDASDAKTLQHGTLTPGRVKLSARMMPALFAVLDRCKRALGLTATVELFCINDASLNAMVTTTSDNRIVIDVTSGSIDTFEDDELAYVLGHEIGHAILGHLDTMRADRGNTTGITSLRSFALKRYQELSADRVGLLCCPDLKVALRAEMMFTTGVRRRSAFGDPMSFLEHARKRMDEVIPPNVSAEGLDTHPYGELRAVAIELFHRSETFHRLREEKGGSLSEKQLEAHVKRIVKLMNPTVLDAKIDREDVAELVLLGAISVAEATRGTSKSEARVIARLAEGYRALHAKLRALSLEEQQIRMVELAEVLALALSYVDRQKILEDMVLVARADGRVSTREHEALEGIAALLGLGETAVAEVLGEASAPLD
jgi:tellurite resistance protein